MCYTYDRLSRVLTRAVKDLNDTYGKQIEHIGTSDVIFAYNGKDGVVFADDVPAFSAFFGARARLLVGG